MRRLLVLGFVLALHAAPAARLAQTRPLQADGVVRLLADLETALRNGHRELFSAISAPDLDADSRAVFERALGSTRVSTATVRERTRLPAGGGFEVLAEVLVSHGRNGRLASWLIKTRPRGVGPPGRFELTSLAEPAALDSLLRLTLDSSRQFAVRNLTVQGPDLVLKMSAGVAFVAEDDDGPTALVLRGAAELVFTPPDAAEQGQLIALAGRPSLTVPCDAAFIRLNSREFQSRVAEKSLTPMAVAPNELARAQTIFDDRSSKTFNLDLRELSMERWSIGPSLGSLIVEFRSNRFGWLTYARAPNEQEDISLFDRARGRNVASYASAERLAVRGQFYSEDANSTYDIERYGIDLSFSPDRRWVQGRASIRLQVTTSAVGTLTFKLAESLVVSSVSSPNFGRLLALRVIGQNNIIVNLPTTVARGTDLIIDVEYAGRVNPQSVDREAARPQGGQSQDQVPLIIEPEPRLLYSNQVYWYPQSQVTDYATAAMRLRVPSEFQIIASGSLVRTAVEPVASDPDPDRETVPRSLRMVEYSTDRPARYLACVISRFGPVGQLRVQVPAVAPQTYKGLPDSAMLSGTAAVNLEVVSTPRMMGKNRQLPGRVADMLRVYANLVGEAPYPDFTVAGIDDNLPGGHSPAFFAVWLQPMATSPYNWSSDPLALDSVYPPYFLAHEVAHQWWGQAVGWKNYHEQWLSEAMAQYFAALYASADRGPSTMRSMLLQMRSSAELFAPQGPIGLGYRLGHIKGDTRVFRAIVYNKGALVLHMLRRLVGDEAFFAGLRRYYRDWRFKKAGTDDLRAAMEAETPIRLERFFARWVLGTSMPTLRVTPVITDTAPGGTAVVKVEQIGDVFDFPLTVSVQYTDGKTEEITIPVTTAVVEHEIRLTGRLRRIVTRDELTLATYVK